jgi:maltooligosyltrehalose trehalohydrolase
MTDYQRIRPASLGVTPLPGGEWQSVVWAPRCQQVDLRLLDDRRVFIPMERDTLGYHRVVVDKIRPAARYLYRLNNSLEYPDPASRLQPEGVHGSSQVVDLRPFEWTDSDWKGIPLEDAVFYELHVGTFTEEGTFAALIPHLDRLADLGVNTVELMPIAQFPGTRNWGYDGVCPFAVQNSYGSPGDLQKLVDSAHARKLSVTLDVVYNHLGPEGNYLGEFGPYFTDRYRTPWGAALNFDGPDSDEVRYFFIQNALYWLQEFHFDALRLDAIHGIFDASAFPFLAELSTAVNSLSADLGRKVHLIAESDLNDARVLRPIEHGGLGMDAEWSDDFHHSLHTLLTGERIGYFTDFGCLHHLATTLKNGWYYAGQYSQHRRRKHGNSASGLKRTQFVVCDQNHDQVGNRALGERLSQLVNFEGLKLAAGITLLSPFVPLLFMGEEYGETTPFQYFTSHTDPQLAEAVRRGRKEEFLAFDWKGEVPDPQAESTFAASKLRHPLSGEEPHCTLQRFYQTLLRFRRDHQLAQMAQTTITDYETACALLVLRQSGTNLLAMLMHFGKSPANLSMSLRPGVWERRIDSADRDWLGPGTTIPLRLELAGPLNVSLQPNSFAVLQHTSPSLE